MADAPSVATPDFTDSVNQAFLIEPLGGPAQPQTYLDRFPEEVYNKSLDSHLVKFVYSLLGPAGVGWIQKQYLDARLQLEEYGIELFDLDAFYGNPLRFGRIIEEVYDDDPRGILDHDAWQRIRARDASYRSRALDYVRGMRLGNTPAGMKLVARSGIGHEVEIVEHYKWLYDQHTDDPLNLVKYGKTNSTEEMVVLPRREAAQSEIQTITINGTVTGGFFTLTYNGKVSANIAWDQGSRENVRDLLGAIPDIGVGNVDTKGGPLPGTPMDILFINDLSFQDVPKLEATNSLTGDGVGILVETIKGGIDGYDQVGVIGPRDQYHLSQALSYVKPQTTIVTYNQAAGTQARSIWSSVIASSGYTEVIRYAVGNVAVPWPSVGRKYWVEGGVEHEAKRIHDDLQHNYIGFHNINKTYAYTDSAIDDVDYTNDIIQYTSDTSTNAHIGEYSLYQQSLYPYLKATDANNVFQSSPDYAPADYFEPLTVTTLQSDANPQQMINGVYPIDYQQLPNVPPVKYRTEQFWGSIERTDGDDYLEIDLGSVRAVNYINFEICRKPFTVELDYDILDMAPKRSFVPIKSHPLYQSNFTVGYSPSYTNPWEQITINFTDDRSQMVYTRFLRLKFARRDDSNSPFIAPDGSRKEYSVEVRNLRAGRLISA